MQPVNTYLFQIVISCALLVSLPASGQEQPYKHVELLVNTSRTGEAMHVLDSLERSGNTLPAHNTWKTYCLLSENKYEDVILLSTRELKKLGTKDTLVPELYFLRGIAYSATGSNKEAIRDTEKAIRLNPNNIKYYLNASYYYGEAFDYGRSVAVLRKALEKYPRNFYLLNNLSYYSTLDGSYKDALDYAERGMKLAGGSAEMGIILNNRGFARIGLKDLKAAEQDIEDALRLYPENAYAYYNRALLGIASEKISSVCQDLNLSVLYGYPLPLDAMIRMYCPKLEEGE